MGEFEEKVRSAFESELRRAPARPGLRQRVIANAVATPRTRQRGFSAWLTPPRLAMVGAAAAVLVVAGVSIRVATQGTPITAHKSPAPSAATLAFGKLPAPGLHPPQGLGAGGGPPTLTPYFGPANMTWSGQLPKVPGSAPVYRFSLPTSSDADAFAARLGATFVSSGATPDSRTYRGPNGYETFIGPDPVAGESVFIMNRDTGPSGGQPLGEVKARAAADAELTRLGLTPSWHSTVAVSATTLVGPSGPIYLYTVQYQRLVDLTSTITAGEVDGNGDPSGIQVTVDSNGTVLRIAGALRLAEKSASYPVRAPSAAAGDAVKAPPLSHESGPPPAVALTKATLVYTVVSSGQIAYLEPAYLFTGIFTVNGYQNEKRVLVPAVAPGGLSS